MRPKYFARIPLEGTLVAFLAACLSLAGCSSPEVPQEDRASLTFGVLADIQYADKETHGSRHYRSSIGKLTDCIKDLNAGDLDFVIQLGDIIDGRWHRDGAIDFPAVNTDLKTVLKFFNQFNAPRYHVVGNHCMVAGAQILHQQLDLEKFYYDFTVPSAKGWRFIVLDGNDAGYGIIGDKQLAWLRVTLDQAAQRDERVICFCHYAVLPAAAEGARMAVTEPVLKVIEDPGCVVAWFAGHHHAGGYAFQKGIHHLTCKGMVEGPTANAYSVVEVHDDKLIVHGSGTEYDRVLPFHTSPAVRQ
jgi:hypothetical protein